MNKSLELFNKLVKNISIICEFTQYGIVISLLQEGDSALHDAVRLNRYKIIKMLILHGADMLAKNLVSFDPLCIYPGLCNLHLQINQ